jgi:hypothetical protein
MTTPRSGAAAAELPGGRKGQEQWKVGHLHARYRYNLLEEMHHGLDPAAETVPWQRLFECTTNSLLSAADEGGESAVDVELCADHTRLPRENCVVPCTPSL